MNKKINIDTNIDITPVSFHRYISKNEIIINAPYAMMKKYCLLCLGLSKIILKTINTS